MKTAIPVTTYADTATTADRGVELGDLLVQTGLRLDLDQHLSDPKGHGSALHIIKVTFMK